MTNCIVQSALEEMLTSGRVTANSELGLSQNSQARHYEGFWPLECKFKLVDFSQDDLMTNCMVQSALEEMLTSGMVTANSELGLSQNSQARHYEGFWPLECKFKLVDFSQDDLMTICMVQSPLEEMLEFWQGYARF